MSMHLVDAQIHKNLEKKKKLDKRFKLGLAGCITE